MSEQNFINYAGEDFGKEFYYLELFSKYPNKGFIISPTDGHLANWEKGILLAVVDSKDMVEAGCYYGERGYVCIPEKESWRLCLGNQYDIPMI